MPTLEITGKVEVGALSDFPSLSSIIRENPNSYVVFSMRQDYDIPLYTVFEYNLENKFNNLFKLLAVTQQYNILMSEIPRGWNTVCVLKAISTPPYILDSLPAVSDWYENKKTIKLSY